MIRNEVRPKKEAGMSAFTKTNDDGLRKPGESEQVPRLFVYVQEPEAYPRAHERHQQNQEKHVGVW